MKIAIIAGEPSGDMLGAMLMDEIRKFNNPIENLITFFGIGGECMIKNGLMHAYDISSLSILGYFDVIKKLIPILRIRRDIIKQIIDFKPNVFIGVDAPDFNFYIEGELKKRGIKTVHYISPAIWAWKYKRIFKIKKTTDLMLCIFPHEEQIYCKEHIKAKFIGNPLANKIEKNIDTNFYKNKLQLNGIIFTVLIGSRKSEIKFLSEIIVKSCNLIHETIPNATFLFPFINQETSQIFITFLEKNKHNFIYKIIINNTLDAIKASDIVLSESGTVTLEAALSKKPLIIFYKIGKFTAWLIRRKVKTKFFGQPNILLNTSVAPELMQEQANPLTISTTFIKLYYDHNWQEFMCNKFMELHNMLLNIEHQNAAKLIFDLIKK